MTLDLKDYSSLQEELARVKRQAQEQAIAQGIRMSALISENHVLREALEFIACEGMDDGDFYAEENITEGTIAMANRARSALSQPLTAQLSETERLRDAVIFRAREAMTQIKDQRTMWPGEVDDMDDALKALDAHLGSERTEERG